MKRLFANRPDWKRILQKRFYCTFVDTVQFTGYVTLLCLDKVREPLWIKTENPVCLVDTGYSWLQHFPQGEHFTITTMFDEKAQIIQLYIDICLRQGVTEGNIPWFDDLFLDIVVTPGGSVKLLDSDELEQALVTGEISKHEYELAFWESENLISQIDQGKFGFFEVCEKHRLLLLQTAQLPP